MLYTLDNGWYMELYHYPLARTFTSQPNRPPPPIPKFGALRKRGNFLPLTHIKTGSQRITQPTPRGIILVVVKREGSNLTPPINLQLYNASCIQRFRSSADRVVMFQTVSRTGYRHQVHT